MMCLPMRAKLFLDVGQKYVVPATNLVLLWINEVLLNEKTESICSVRQGTSEVLDANLDPTTSADENDTSKFNNVVFENDFVESKERKDDGAKREIQSLVKLNLKLLSRDKHLGTVSILNLVLVYICIPYPANAGTSYCIVFIE